MIPKKAGLRMIAANGTDIKNVGQQMIKFRGVAAEPDESVFGWRA